MYLLPCTRMHVYTYMYTYINIYIVKSDGDNAQLDLDCVNYLHLFLLVPEVSDGSNGKSKAIQHNRFCITSFLSPIRLLLTIILNLKNCFQQYTHGVFYW